MAKRKPVIRMPDTGINLANSKNPDMVAGKIRLFLEQLAVDGNITRAAEFAQLDRPGIYARRKTDPAFEEAMQDAFEKATDRLEAEARRRGLEGYDEPVFYQGVQTATMKRYSDPLLIMLLKGNRRKYATNTTEVANVPGETFKVESTPTQDARKLLFMLKAAALAAEQNPDGPDNP